MVLMTNGNIFTNNNFFVCLNIYMLYILCINFTNLKSLTFSTKRLYWHEEAPLKYDSTKNCDGIF